MFLPIDSPCDHARPRRHAHSRLDHDSPLGSEERIHTRAELDQPDALPGFYMVARLFGKDDAARDQPGDLLEDDARSIALHGHDVLLVIGGADFLAGDQKLPGLIAYAGDGAPDR